MMSTSLSNRPAPTRAVRKKRTDVLSESEPIKIALGASAGWAIAWATGTEFLCLLVAAVVGFFALRWFWKLLANPQQLSRMLALGAVALIAELNVGYVVAWASSTIGLEKDFSETFNQLNLSFGQYSGAVFYAMLFALALALIGRIPLTRRMEEFLSVRLLEARQISQGALIGLIGLCIAIDAIAYGSGILRFREMVTAGSQQGRVATFMPFLQMAFAAQIFLNVFLLSKAFERPPVRLVALGIASLSIAANILVYFNLGRSALILALALHFIYWCFIRGRRPRARALVPLAIVLLLIVPKMLAISNFMRSGGIAQDKTGRGEDTFSVLEKGMSQLSDKKIAEVERKSSYRNLSFRPLVATPLARCLSMDESVKSYMWGYNIVSSFVWSVPRVLFPGKVRFSSLEGLLFRYFPDQSFLLDTSDSVYLYSYADFSWLGLLIYPLLIAAFWVVSLVAIQFLKKPLFVWLAFSAWPAMFLLSLGEGSLTGWFVITRNTFMFVGILCVLQLVWPEVRKRRLSIPNRRPD